MNKMKYDVLYTTEVVNTNTNVTPDGCSDIWFENIGDVDATIAGNIPLQVGDKERKFENDPGAEIKSSWPISFSTGPGTKSVLVIKVFKQIKSC
jgi:hypothetical protein